MSKEKPASPKKAGNPIAEAYEKYDKSTFIPKKIREGIEAIGAGAYLREQEFMRLCGVGNGNDLARYREQFSDFWVEIGGRNPHRLWFGLAKDAEDFRERISTV